MTTPLTVATGPALRIIATIRRAAETRRPKAILTHAEEVSLGRLLRHDDLNVVAEARAVFCERNQALVKSLADKWYTGEIAALDWEDIFQFGNEGLVIAVEKYDPERGLKFSTYATWWIKQRIARALDDYRGAVRLPVHMAEDIRKLKKAENDLTARTGRQPSDAELSLATGIKPDKIARVRLAQQTAAVTSLDAQVYREGSNAGEREYHEVIGDPHSDPADEALDRVEDAEQRALVERLLAKLPPRQREIMRLRHGFGNEKPHTLQEIAERIGLTRERVRQIEQDALTDLRWHAARLLTNSAAD